MADDRVNERRADARTAADLAQQAGVVLLDWLTRLKQEDIGRKSADCDLVTQADLASEKLLLDGLRESFPDDGILAEESGASKRDADHVWYVDPLDGTVNFVHRLPMFAVSIARVARGARAEPEVAVVHIPLLGETFVAVRGGGCTLNGAPTRVSRTGRPDDALLATGFPYRRRVLNDNNLENFNRLFLRQRGIRRMGAAAADLAYVAAGRLDAFWELHLSPWDVAAGGLLVQEAGGIVDTLVSGGDWLHGRNLIAGPAALVAELRQLLLAGRGRDYPDLSERAQ
jgi:myo-inositol-1(or 4)-monophosphatase